MWGLTQTLVTTDCTQGPGFLADGDEIGTSLLDRFLRAESS